MQEKIIKENEEAIFIIPDDLGRKAVMLGSKECEEYCELVKKYPNSFITTKKILGYYEASTKNCTP